MHISECVHTLVDIYIFICLWLLTYAYVYMYIYICLCVYVCAVMKMKVLIRWLSEWRFYCSRLFGLETFPSQNAAGCPTTRITVTATTTTTIVSVFKLRKKQGAADEINALMFTKKLWFDKLQVTAVRLKHEQLTYAVISVIVCLAPIITIIAKFLIEWCMEHGKNNSRPELSHAIFFSNQAKL